MIPVNSGNLVLHLIAALEAKGILSVYLRNYEGLPQEVGNDVDLLVPKGMRRRAVVCETFNMENWSKGWMKAVSAVTT